MCFVFFVGGERDLIEEDSSKARTYRCCRPNHRGHRRNTRRHCRLISVLWLWLRMDVARVVDTSAVDFRPYSNWTKRKRGRKKGRTSLFRWFTKYLQNLGNCLKDDRLSDAGEVLRRFVAIDRRPTSILEMGNNLWRFRTENETTKNLDRCEMNSFRLTKVMPNDQTSDRTS